jgi:peptidoglycan DL-endopeptidase CwlO
MPALSTKSPDATSPGLKSPDLKSQDPKSPGTKYSAKHGRVRRVRISRRTSMALGGLAVGSLVLSPNIANADPKPTIEQVQAQLDTLNRQAADADEQYNAAQVAEQQLQSQLTGVNAQIAQDEVAMNGAKDRLGSIAATQYRTGGGIDPTMQLLMESDPQKLLDMAGTMDRASTANATALVDVAQAKASLTAQQKTASAKLAALDKTTKDAEAKKKSFDDSVSKSQTRTKV